MRKLWVALSITLVLSLVWCAIPAIGSWSWAADPVFVIKDGHDQFRVNAEIEVGFSGKRGKFDPKKVKVVLDVPRHVQAEVWEDGGFSVEVKDDYKKKGEAEVQVVVEKRWRKEYSLPQVTVTYDDGRTIEPKKQGPYKWVFNFELPEAHD